MRSPSRLTTSTVASSSTLSEIEILSVSRLPSPLGENERVIAPTVMTGGVLLSRCATKNAENEAATNTRKVTLVTSVMAPTGLARLVGANDDDHVPLLRPVGDQRLRRVVEELDGGDAERVGHAA